LLLLVEFASTNLRRVPYADTKTGAAAMPSG
jgi:hypothetical protein